MDTNVKIVPDEVEKAVRYLVENQVNDGSYLENGRVFHKRMQVNAQTCLVTMIVCEAPLSLNPRKCRSEKESTILGGRRYKKYTLYHVNSQKDGINVLLRDSEIKAFGKRMSYLVDMPCNITVDM